MVPGLLRFAFLSHTVFLIRHTDPQQLLTHRHYNMSLSTETLSFVQLPVLLLLEMCVIPHFSITKLPCRFLCVSRRLHTNTLPVTLRVEHVAQGLVCPTSLEMPNWFP